MTVVDSVSRCASGQATNKVTRMGIPRATNAERSRGGYLLWCGTAVVLQPVLCVKPTNRERHVGEVNNSERDIENGQPVLGNK